MIKLIAFFTSLCLLSCNADVKKETDSYKQVKDQLGRTVKVPLTIRKVLGLSPSSTEMIYAVCPDSVIAGRTQNCDYPEKALAKPVVNNYPLDLEALLMLKPDIVFAVEGITPLDDARRIEEMGIAVYFQKFDKVNDVFKGLQEIGELTGNKDKADHVVDSLRKVLNAISDNAKNKRIARVLYIIWPDPIYAHGYYSIMSDKLKYAGAVNALDSTLKKTSPELSREYIIKTDPDVLISSSGKLEQEFFDRYPELRNMRFYKGKKVLKASDDLHSRPSPRIVESVKELYTLIHEN